MLYTDFQRKVLEENMTKIEKQTIGKFLTVKTTTYHKTANVFSLFQFSVNMNRMSSLKQNLSIKL